MSNHTHIAVVFVGLEDPDIIEVLDIVVFALVAAHDDELLIVETAEAYVFAGCDHGEDKHFKSGCFVTQVGPFNRVGAI